MDKKILADYIDACELIRETEEDIRKLDKKKSIITGKASQVVNTSTD
jgi:hypothetical protein